MDIEEFRRNAKQAVDYVADYMETIRDRRVQPDVQPGFLVDELPDEAPDEPQQWEQVLNDVEKYIIPGLLNCHSPGFHAYYPVGYSMPAVCAEILASGLGTPSYTWTGTPSNVELEIAMMKWLAQALDLPQHLWCGEGGGVIQGSASEATLISLLAARSEVTGKMCTNINQTQTQHLQAKLVAYTSEECHSSVEKACLIGNVTCRLLETDENCRLRGATLLRAMQNDKSKGFIPFFVVATLGTTNSCAFDALAEIGPVCSTEGVWLHIDAAYAGACFVCPEMRYLMQGVEHATSFNFNPHKVMLVNFECSCLWFKNQRAAAQSFSVEEPYMNYDNQDRFVDPTKLLIPLGTNFRALKIWFVMRMYGISGLQKHVRNQIKLAKELERLLQQDESFEITNEVKFGLICFRLKNASKATNERLLKELNAAGQVLLGSATSHGMYYLRCCIGSTFIEVKDVHNTWKIIQVTADTVLNSKQQ